MAIGLGGAYAPRGTMRCGRAHGARLANKTRSAGRSSPSEKKHADCERTAPKLTPRWTRLSAFGSRWHGHHLAASDGPGALIGLPGGPCGLVRSGQVGQVRPTGDDSASACTLSKLLPSFLAACLDARAAHRRLIDRSPLKMCSTRPEGTWIWISS